MKAFIIDDEHANREVIQIMLRKYFPGIEIIGEADNPKTFLNSPSLQQSTDLLFLDILMPEKTGFDLLNQLSSRSFEVILVTGFEEFALQAFEHSVIDYVLKPIDKDRFCSAVEKAEKRISERKLVQSVKTQLDQAKIAVIKNNKTIYIEASGIAYMVGESGGYTTIFCKNGGSYLLSKSLSAMENESSEIPFLIRVNQSVIINMEDIVSADKGGSGYVGLRTNQFEVFLPRRKKREVLQQIEAYWKFR